MGGVLGPGELTEALDSLLDPWRASGMTLRAGWCSASEGDPDGLYPSERVAVAAAIDARRREFAAGRRLLRAITGCDVPIPVADDRSPILPVGHRGSLTHDDGVVVAVVAPSAQADALGVDLASWIELDPGERSLIMRHDDADVAPIVAFSLKEAAYKAWSSLGGRMLEHHEMRLERTGDHEVVAEVMIGESRGRRLSGRWCRAGDRVLAVVVVSAQPGCAPSRRYGDA